MSDDFVGGTRPCFALLGMPARVFAQRHWGRRALRVRGAGGRFSEWLDGPTLFRLTVEHALTVKAATRDADGLQVERSVDPTAAAAAFAEGATICVQGLHRHVPAFARLLAGLKLELGAAGAPEASCYFSPPGHGFRHHYDDSHVFILQLQGAKHWCYGLEPALHAPPVNLMASNLEQHAALRPWAKVAPPPTTALRESTLEPGDVLYLPPGTWHEANARETSLGVTLSFGALRFRDYLLRRIEERLDSELHFRAHLPLLVDDGAEGELTRHLESCRASVRALLADLDAADFADFIGQRISRVPLAPPPPPREVVGDLRVNDAWPVRSVELRCAFVLRHLNQEVRLPPRAAGWYAALREHARFDVERAVALGPPVAEDEKLGWLAALIRADIVVVDEDLPDRPPEATSVREEANA